MIQVGDLVKHRNLGGLGLVKQVVRTNYTRTEIAYQATIQWLINPYDPVDHTVLWTKHLEKSENK